MNDIRIDKLLKAQAVFEEFRIDMKDDRDKAGAVQAFEFCYELAWKLMKKILESRGQEVGSPKDTFRKAAIEKLIDDPEVWFEFQQKKLTTHTYELENLQLIVDTFDLFSTELKNFIIRTQSLE
jgi:nucleotidyltransferase substrate binding protein (TIGR01987 family)